MNPRVHLLALVVVAAASLIQSLEGAEATTGALTWGQSCNPSASLFDDQSTRCDTSKRLSCDMKSRTCKCHHEERDFHNSGTDRCETKIGKFCSASETFPTICVNNAVCDTASNFCVCEQDAEANDDGTECIKEGEAPNAGVTPRQSLSVQVAITIFAIIVGTRVL